MATELDTIAGAVKATLVAPMPAPARCILCECRVDKGVDLCTHCDEWAEAMDTEEREARFHQPAA
jgi:hypothetical protein